MLSTLFTEAGYLSLEPRALKFSYSKQLDRWNPCLCHLSDGVTGSFLCLLVSYVDARYLNSGFHTSMAGALSMLYLSNPFCSKDILTFYAGTTILLNTEV